MHASLAENLVKHGCQPEPALGQQLLGEDVVGVVVIVAEIVAFLNAIPHVGAVDRLDLGRPLVRADGRVLRLALRPVGDFLAPILGNAPLDLLKVRRLGPQLLDRVLHILNHTEGSILLSRS